MDLGLDGARAVITGGSRGLGLAIADALAAEGADVALLARTASTLEQAAEQVGRHGHRVITRAVDVTDLGDLAAAVDWAADTLGGLDRVVANAGGTISGGNLMNSEPSDFVETFVLNGGHAFAAVKAAVPHLVAAGGGSVAIVSSITGMRPAPRTAYATAKAAEIHLAATLAQELAPRRIRVNAVSPGSIMFPGGSWDRFERDSPEVFGEFVEKEFPWGRLGTAQEVGDVVAFLLSDRAAWVTGANIVVDGAQKYPSARTFE